MDAKRSGSRRVRSRAVRMLRRRIASVVTKAPASEEQPALEARCVITVDTMIAITSVFQALPTCLARGSIRRRASAPPPYLHRSFAVHHVIPIILATHDIVGRVNHLWDQNDPDANGIVLPTSRAESMRSNLPYHAGPHPRYSRSIELILDRMANFRNSVGWISDQLLPVFTGFVSHARKTVLNLPPGSSVNECSIEWQFVDRQSMTRRQPHAA